jgi:hypothetical protein
MSQTKVQLIKDGALAEDSIVHDGDTNTKIRFSGTDTVSVETAGSERLVVQSDGDIGLATTTPNLVGYTAPTVSIGKSGNAYSVVELQGTQASNGAVGVITGYNTSGTSRIATINWNRQAGNNYGSLSFETANNGSLGERCRVTNDGLTFGGDTAAANALDDYEEGSWTPGNSDMGVTVHYARYTKIGRLVHIVADVEYASSPADTSQVGYLTGLPFQNGDKSVHQHLPWFGTSAANDNQFFNTYFTPLIFANDDKFSFLNSNSGTFLTRAQLASKKVRLNSTYYTSY